MSYIPGYSFIKCCIMCFIFIEEEFAVRFMILIEDQILKVEEKVDKRISKAIGLVGQVSVYFLKLVVRNSSSTLQGASVPKLRQLEHICGEYVDTIEVTTT